jgi:cation:H+ antiporter
MEILAYATAFAASGAVVVWAGSRLAQAADRIAELTGIARVWIGGMLLAGATSLPELAIDVAAVRLDAADLAAGDLFGSSLANMLILAGLDLAYPRERLLRSASLDHALSACLAIALHAVAAILVFTRPEATFAGLSPGSVALAVAYLAGSRAVYRHVRRGGSGAAAGRERIARAPLRAAAWRFAFGAAVVLAAAPALAWSARGLAEASGLGATFVGTWLVGLTTSLPELVASLAAVRMRAFDLAIGNLFGSNAFNMVIFLALDLASPGGAIFARIDPAHLVTALFAIVLTSLGLASIVYRAERRFGMLEPDSLLVVLAYLLALGVLYAQTAAS